MAFLAALGTWVILGLLTNWTIATITALGMGWIMEFYYGVSDETVSMVSVKVGGHDRPTSPPHDHAATAWLAKQPSGPGPGPGVEEWRDLVEALKGLGYKPSTAKQLASYAIKHAPPQADLTQLIKLALSNPKDHQ